MKRQIITTEDQLALTDKKETYIGPKLQLPNKATMNLKNTENIPLSGNLILHAKKTHIFDRIHSASPISLVQLCNDDCIIILDNNETDIIKYSNLILKGQRNKSDGLWDIPTSRSFRNRAN